MKSQLIGKPLNLTQIEAMKCEILLLLRSAPRSFNSEIIRRIVCGSDLGKLVEFAVALTRLEQQGEITIATLGMQMFIKLASTADEAQGSTSRSVAGEKELSAAAWEDTFSSVAKPIEPSGIAGSAIGSENQASPAGNSDFSILHRPHIVRKKEEVHVELCHECERMASGHCECGLPVCGAHRYSSDGERNPHGMCGKCQKEISGHIFEVFNSCGRQV